MKQLTISVSSKACPNCGEEIKPQQDKCPKCHCMLEWEYEPKLVSDIVPHNLVNVVSTARTIHDVDWIFSQITDKRLILAYCSDTLQPSDTRYIVEATHNGLAYIRYGDKTSVKMKCYLVRVSLLTKVTDF